MIPKSFFLNYNKCMKLDKRSNLKLGKKPIIVKLSSLAVTQRSGGIHTEQFKTITSEIAKLKNKYKRDIIIISSGAINAGKNFIKTSLKKEMSSLQAYSAIGQPILMSEYIKTLAAYNIGCAQVLVTHEDLKNKKRSLNIKNAIQAILNEDFIPILNENDSVSFDEISLGDNDQLAAMISHLLEAKLLIMLTQASGLFSGDPDDKNSHILHNITDMKETSKIKFGNKSSAGKGGMENKLQAIGKCVGSGTQVLLGSFTHTSPLLSLIQNDNHGSFFMANSLQKSKKSWLQSRAKLDVAIIIDEGASLALTKNASLLPVGIKKLIGKFNRGDILAIKYQNKIIAYGITEYSSNELKSIKGLKMSEWCIKPISKVAVHKNNLHLVSPQ